MEDNEKPDKETEAIQILENIIRMYAIDELSTTSKGLSNSMNGDNIWNGLCQSKYSLHMSLLGDVTVKTTHGKIKISRKDYDFLVRQIIDDLVDEKFLVKNGDKYSLNISSEKLAAKAFRVQQNKPKPNKTLMTIGSIFKTIIAIFTIITITLIAFGFQWYETGGYDFDGKTYLPWDIDNPLSPARGLTGTWSGTYDISEFSTTPAWRVTGKTYITFKQNGNQISGSYKFEGENVKYITGTVSSSQITFTDGFRRFSGSFTTDLMKINVESCSLNNYCSDPARESDHSYVSEPGIKGTITLIKDR